MDDLEKLLREKLAFLESELVKLSDPTQKFTVFSPGATAISRACATFCGRRCRSSASRRRQGRARAR